MHFKELFIYLFERATEKEGEAERSSTYWLTPQMRTVARAESATTNVVVGFPCV